MKINILLSLSVIFGCVSCRSNRNTVYQEPLPTVVSKVPTEKKPVYKPKKKTAVKETTPETSLDSFPGYDPLKPDPANTLLQTEIPKFEVPQNIQPKVPDGIDQGAFIELRWSN